MLVYAGIDEAGYGPMFGPLTLGRAVFAVPDAVGASTASAAPPDLWRLLSRAVCREHTGRAGRLTINDSKKVYSPSSGLKHLELGVLTFTAAWGHRPSDLAGWLDCLGEASHRDRAATPWYVPCAEHPWQPVPVASTAGEVAVARNMLAQCCKEQGVEVLDLGLAVVFEDHFNRMVAATRSKAAMSFTFVARHLVAIWEKFGHLNPVVVVDRQSGRSHYRELLALAFPQARLTILDETDERSAYRIEQRHPAAQPPVAVSAAASNSDVDARPSRLAPSPCPLPHSAMTVSFEVSADGQHLPVALASMIAKYARERLMERFNTWFTRRAPHIKPTAGYAADAKRFWRELEPCLGNMGVDAAVLVRAR